MTMLIDSSTAMPSAFNHGLDIGDRLVVYGDDIKLIETFLKRCGDVKFAFAGNMAWCFVGAYSSMQGAQIHDATNLVHTKWAKNTLGHLAPPGFGLLAKALGLMSGKAFVGVVVSNDLKPENAKTTFVLNQKDDLKNVGGFINAKFPNTKGSFSLSDLQQKL